MNPEFPADRQQKQKMLLAAVESIRETLTACTDQAEAISTLPIPAVEAIYDAGLFSLKLPAVLGGAEADPITQTEVIEAMARIDSSAAWCMMIGATSIGSMGAFLSDEAIDQIFFSGGVPKAAGVGDPSGSAEAVDGGYIVTGQWSFGSGIRHSDWVSGGVRVAIDGAEPPELRRVVMRTSDVTIHDDWDVAGLRGTGSYSFSVKEMFVPESFTWVLGKPHKRGGPIYLMGRPGFVINEHAGFALGLGRRALDGIMEMAKSKWRGRSGRSLVAERPTFQRAVGECDLRLRAARALMMEILEEAWETVCKGHEPDARLQAEMRSCATFVTDVALDVVTQAFRYGGGEALHAANDLQRCLRDMNAAAQHFMVNDSAYENHGQFALGLPDADPMG